MKVGIVWANLVHEKVSLNAHAYLGDTQDVDRQIATAELTLKRTKARLRTLKREKVKMIATAKKLAETGRVKPIDPS
jgi:hypothetical protein